MHTGFPAFPSLFIYALPEFPSLLVSLEDQYAEDQVTAIVDLQKTLT
jgi:hypothetical protein